MTVQFSARQVGDDSRPELGLCPGAHRSSARDSDARGDLCRLRSMYVDVLKGRGQKVIQFGRFSLLTRRRELLDYGSPVNLGSRALDVLMVLIERSGQLVTKQELLNRVWPSTTVEENCLQFQVSRLRKVLGQDRDFIRTVSGRGYRFVADATVVFLTPRALELGLAANSTRRGVLAPSNLPPPTSNLIGRDKLLPELASQVIENRLVTLVGPGGIGKTRLAIELARCLAPQFEGGVWIAELAPLSDPSLILSAIASAVGLDPAAASREPLADLLGAGPRLLVLDNCEHLIDAAATTAEALLQANAGLHVVATSRQPLRGEGEWVCHVPALDLPPQGPAAIADLLTPSAVKLFVARARAAAPGLRLDGRTAAAAAEICRRLDGIPLAIEFAALASAALGVEGLAARAEDLLPLLTHGRRTAPPRHQTLRAALDWSYALLPALEQAVLRRLALFSGDFTMDQASAVAAGGDVAPADVLSSVANLVTKSLVLRDDVRPVPRFRLLATSRAYALGKLEECGEVDPVTMVHASPPDNRI
jgi:predicted ATPase/DNA-binding winged helix-turn-helix (wHTH) protein